MGARVCLCCFMGRHGCIDVHMRVNDFMTLTCRKALHDGDGHPMGADAAQSRTSALDSGQGKYNYVMRCCHPAGDYSMA